MVLRRKRIFVCAEGESERSFAQWLQILCDKNGKHLHLDIIVAGGGDSLSITRTASHQYNRRKRDGRFYAGFALLDSDRLQRDSQAGRAPTPETGLRLIYMRPNMEGVLLRLHPGMERLSPAVSDANRKLQQRWPNYRKPPSARDLRIRFDIDDLRRAAQNDEGLKWVTITLGLWDKI